MEWRRRKGWGGMEREGTKEGEETVEGEREKERKRKRRLRGRGQSKGGKEETHNSRKTTGGHNGPNTARKLF